MALWKALVSNRKAEPSPSTSVTQRGDKKEGQFHPGMGHETVPHLEKGPLVLRSLKFPHNLPAPYLSIKTHSVIYMELEISPFLLERTSRKIAILTTKETMTLNP